MVKRKDQDPVLRLVKDVDAEAWREILTRKEPKDRPLSIRVSARDHEDMQATAKALGLSVAEYLTRLHRVAHGRMK
ncbi:MAG: hypothetical protein AMXMBFR75_32480 [Candidatus Hinthialibacteria bacterium]